MSMSCTARCAVALSIAATAATGSPIYRTRPCAIAGSSLKKHATAHFLKILPGNHRVDPRQLPRSTGVVAYDPGMRMRTYGDRPIEHACRAAAYRRMYSAAPVAFWRPSNRGTLCPTAVLGAFIAQAPVATWIAASTICV